MKIISYNVNGLRAAIGKGLLDWLALSGADVVCLQEIKATPEQLPLDAIAQAGFPHHYWYPAQKKGYSGVAILAKEPADHVVYGTGIEHMDFEGRNLRADFGQLSIMSFYMPSGTNALRIPHKFRYMDDFHQYIAELRKERPHLVLCGDYNICHEAIDIHDPVRNVRVSGFLPEEREWFGSFIKAGFVDSFRHFNKNPNHYTWWSNFANARSNNKGWRLDFALVANALEPRLRDAQIFPDARHSDHCPILVEIEHI